MSYIIVGLGNPGEEYKNTRHNAGRIALEYFRKEVSFPEWVEDRKSKSLLSEGSIGRNSIILLEPNNFMNNSGESVAMFVTSKKKAEKLIVVYDDIDIPLGKIKISYNRGSGGHKGVESIIRNIKTKAFIRIRVGVAQTTPTGKIKKPKGDNKVLDFLMGEFKQKEIEIFKNVSKSVVGAINTIINDGVEKAMNVYN